MRVVRLKWMSLYPTARCRDDDCDFSIDVPDRDALRLVKEHIKANSEHIVEMNQETLSIYGAE